MSKASRQSKSLIAVICGIFITIDSYRLIPELAPTIKYGLDICLECYQTFPDSGDKRKNDKWMSAAIGDIDKDLNGNKHSYSTIVLVSIAHHIINDLQESISDPHKLNLLDPIAEVVSGLNHKIDPLQDCFEAYEEADRLLARLYSRLGFNQ